MKRELIVIDPSTHTVARVVVGDGDVFDLARELIGCQMVEHVYNTGLESLRPSHGLLVDEEGLMNDDPACFLIEGGTQPYAGKAVVVNNGGDEFGFPDEDLKPEDVEELVNWRSPLGPAEQVYLCTPRIFPLDREFFLSRG
jgi:hypothetical protein